MSKFDYYTGAFKKYATFTGRATRSEFWYFVLFNLIISIVLNLISESLAGLYQLAVLIPSLAISARRLHDIGKSGWMQLVSLIPLIGLVWLVILFARKGDNTENEYGAPVTAMAAKENNEELKETIGDKVDAFTDQAKDFDEKVSDKVEDFADQAEYIKE